jgi:hypothetical protein
MKEYNTYIMQIGEGMGGPVKGPEKKKYKRIDKRTKKYGNPRKHDGVMGKYKSKHT